ncbi:MAG: hypothetical protein WBV75_04200, partial [Robiginitalea sp.]
MRKWLKRGIRFFGIVLSGSLVLVCIHYFLPLPVFPILDAISIVVPWLILANLLYFILCLLLRTKHFLLPLLALLIAFLSFGSFYGFISRNEEIPPKESFTLMTYNTRGFKARGYH